MQNVTFFDPQIVGTKLDGEGGSVEISRDLVIVEPGKHEGIPFDVSKRTYTVIAHEDVEIGGHYHAPGKSEAMLLITGSIELRLHGHDACETTQMTPQQGVVVGENVWHDLTIAKGTVMIVLTEGQYSPGEAIDKGFGNCACGRVKDN